STAPTDAAGPRAGQSRAASTEDSSRMMNPAQLLLGIGEDADLDERLVVSAPGGEIGTAIVVFPCVKSGLPYTVSVSSASNVFVDLVFPSTDSYTFGIRQEYLAETHVDRIKRRARDRKHQLAWQRRRKWSSAGTSLLFESCLQPFDNGFLVPEK